MGFENRFRTCKMCKNKIDMSFYDSDNYGYRIGQDYYCGYKCYSKAIDEYNAKQRAKEERREQKSSLSTFIISDIHGKDFWKEVKEFIKQSKKIIFLGDYFDSYTPEEISREKEIQNFLEILEFKKKHPKKITLLLGNHDMNQYILNEEVSRKSSGEANKKITKLLNDNIKYFNITDRVDNYVVSHAGISRTWMENNKLLTTKNINDLLKDKKYEAFGWNGSYDDIYGDTKTQSPMWIRPGALFEDMYFPKQIVGHTKVEKSPYILKKDGKELIMIECEEGYILEIEPREKIAEEIE